MTGSRLPVSRSQLPVISEEPEPSFVTERDDSAMKMPSRIDEVRQSAGSYQMNVQRRSLEMKASTELYRSSPTVQSPVTGPPSPIPRLYQTTTIINPKAPNTLTPTTLPHVNSPPLQPQLTTPIKPQPPSLPQSPQIHRLGSPQNPNPNSNPPTTNPPNPFSPQTTFPSSFY